MRWPTFFNRPVCCLLNEPGLSSRPHGDLLATEGTLNILSNEEMPTNATPGADFHLTVVEPCGSACGLDWLEEAPL